MIEKQLYFGYDALYHVERIKQYHLAILEGQIPPRLAPTSVYGYTYPLFVVNYHLPYILAEPLMLVTNDAVFAYKAIMSASFVLGAVFVFLFFRKIASDFASLCGAVVYCYNPYRFASLYHRGAIGESLAIALLPLIFLGIHKIAEGTKHALPFTALAVFAVINSHSLVLLISAPLFLVYVLFFLKLNMRKFLQIGIAFLWGFALSAFQILPSLFEKKFMKFDEILLSHYNEYFRNFFQIYGLPLNEINQNFYFQVGLVTFFISFISLVLLVQTKDKKVFALLIINLLTTFLITDWSVWFWNHLSILRSLVFPWRLMSLLILSSSILTVKLVDNFRVKFLGVILGVFLILSAIITSGHFFLSSGLTVPNVPNPTLTVFRENDPIWSTEATFKKGPTIDMIPYSDVRNLKNEPFDISFDVDLNTDSDILIRRIYFPGWIVRVNGLRKNIHPEDGFLSTSLQPGRSHVEVIFRETPLRKFANFLSLASFLTLIFFYFKKANITQVFKKTFPHI